MVIPIQHEIIFGDTSVEKTKLHSRLNYTFIAYEQ